MSRDTDFAVTSANAQTALQWALLCQLGLSTGAILYTCTGGRYLNDGVNTYTPVGHLGGVEAVVEESTLFPRAVKLWLSAVGSANLYEPLTENLFNKSVRLFRASLSSSLSIVGTPQQCFRGYVNKVDIKLGDDQKGNYFEIEAESRIRREASSNFYTTENHDQMLAGVYSGDTIFKYVPRIQGYQSKWGAMNQSLDGTGGGGPGSGRSGGGGKGR
jgi:hypothetical protein